VSDSWTFTWCMACRQQAWRAPDGETFCGTCEAREARLQQALGQVASPPVFRTLRTALLGGSSLRFPMQAGA